MLYTVKLIGLFWLLAGGLVTAQPHQVLSSGGDTGVTAQVKGDYTIGEPFIATLSSQLSQLTQGFHQFDLMTTSVNESFEKSVRIDVYPNPFEDRILIRIDDNLEIGMIRLYDVNGKIVHFSTGQLGSYQQGDDIVLTLGHLNAGMLILQIFDSQLAPIKSIPIIKL